MVRLSSKTSKLFSGTANTAFRLFVYLLLSLLLLGADFRAHWLSLVQQQASMVIEPLYRLVSLPSHGMETARIAFSSRQHLTKENRRLRQDLLVANAKLNRMAAVVKQNDALKQLMDMRQKLGINMQLARVIDVNTGIFRHRIIIDAGKKEGISSGQSVIDAEGIVGQVSNVMPTSATVILISDIDAATPVVIPRTGLRTIAYGTQSGELSLPNIPVSADVQAGDDILSSGLGGVYPAGFPVGTITHVKTDASGMFLTARAEPAANLGHSNYVLLIQPIAPPIGPPDPAKYMGPSRDKTPQQHTVKKGES